MFHTCAIPGCPWCTPSVKLAHPEDAVPARTSAMRDFYPAAERLERAIANAEVD